MCGIALTSPEVAAMTKHRVLLTSFLLLAAVPAFADDAEDASAQAVQKLGGRVVRFDSNRGPQYITVDLTSSKATDADLKDLAGLKAARFLNLTRTAVTDAGLQELAPLALHI